MKKGTTKEPEFKLLKLASKGDEAAFRQLYDSTYGKVTFYLRRLISDENLVEDVLVETYTAVWKGAKSFKGKSKVSTWIIGIARNVAMNELRRLKTHEDLDAHYEISDDSLPDTESFDRQGLMKKALLKLTPKHREILDLVFFHEMRYPEVSELLDIPVSTVKTRVFYAKDALKDVLKHMGVDKHDI